MSRRLGADELPLMTAVLKRLLVLVAIFLLKVPSRFVVCVAAERACSPAVTTVSAPLHFDRSWPALPCP